MNDSELLQTIRECLARNYGISGELERLPGENLNFLVTETCGQKHVFKIVDEDMPAEVVAMEYAVLEHAASAGFGLRLPKIIETKNANIEERINIRKNKVFRSRIIEFIDGEEMSSLSDISEDLLFDLGKVVADFDRVMADFDHPSAHRSHRWNLAEADQHEDKISLIREAENQELLRWSFDVWRQARPGLNEVPWQIIHGDAHDENVLVRDDRVVGLIDFGDCCYNPTVCDPAICLTYLMMRGDPAHIAAVVTRGYEQVRPLGAAEKALLYPLICGRLAVSVCVANKRKTIDPDNPNWFGGEGRAWALLRWLREYGPRSLAEALV